MNFIQLLKKEKYLIITILIFFIIYNFIVKTYIIPSVSMTNTMKVGDYYIGLKYHYGIKIPNFFMTNIKMFPDINQNNYLIKFNEPELSDIIIFKQPLTNEIFIKRCFAKGGDEILLKPDNQIYLHKKEGNEFIIKNYNKTDYINFKNKLWIKNPYKKDIKGIHYNDNNNSSYKLLYSLYFENFSSETIKENKQWKRHLTFDKENKYFTYKLKEKEYYMIGDNRDDSLDSRFFGAITFKDLEAKAYKVLFNPIEDNRTGILLK